MLALDYGRARTGIAVSDPTGTLARPVGVVRRVRSRPGRAELLRRIGELEPDVVVVGLPVSMDGTRGRQAGETLAFVAELEHDCPVPVKTYDERLTTAMAKRLNGRDDDALAAAHLLEGYLRQFAG